MAAKLAKLGVEPELMSVEQFGKFVKDDYRRDGAARQGRRYQAGGLKFVIASQAKQSSPREARFWIASGLRVARNDDLSVSATD